LEPEKKKGIKTQKALLLRDDDQLHFSAHKRHKHQKKREKLRMKVSALRFRSEGKSATNLPVKLRKKESLHYLPKRREKGGRGLLRFFSVFRGGGARLLSW